jgi:hypothetical protein
MANKYEQEIEEILKRAGESPPVEAQRDDEKPADDRPKAKPRPVPRQELGGYARGVGWPAGLTAITPGKVLLAGLVVLLIAVLVEARILVWAGLAMVAIGYVGHFMRPRSAPVQKYWRQRPLETPPQSAMERFKRWIRG